MHVSGIDFQRFRANLIAWGRVHGRSFPWRETRDPYKILLSEVLLHRTRAEQVVGLYERLIGVYPTIHALANAPMAHLHDLLRSAGLRWRVDLLGAAAQELVERFGGQVPRSHAALESLPGVGPYIAGAVSCFAYGEAVPLLDTNTVRIVGRVYGLPVSDGSRRSKLFRDIMARLVDPIYPREFNYALLDLGALVCRPTRPEVLHCPLAADCEFAKVSVPQTRAPGVTPK